MSNRSDSGGRWAVFGAIGAALIASSCCILPLVLGAVGISTLALAGLFEAARPYMLVVTTLLLGLGIYAEYFREPACEPGDACEVPRPGVRRMTRTWLWLGAGAVVALALFPSYAFVFAGGEAPALANASQIESRQVVLEVDGMTCEACTVSVQNALADVPGVLRSEVDFRAGQAIVLVRADSAPSARELLAAVSRAGYPAVIVSSGGRGEG